MKKIILIGIIALMAIFVYAVTMTQEQIDAIDFSTTNLNEQEVSYLAVDGNAVKVIRLDSIEKFNGSYQGTRDEIKGSFISMQFYKDCRVIKSKTDCIALIEGMLDVAYNGKGRYILDGLGTLRHRYQLSKYQTKDESGFD